MPQYCFICPKCAHKETVIRRIADRNDSLECPKCSGLPPMPWPNDEAHSLPKRIVVPMMRDIQGESFWSDNSEYQTPVLSDSMGVHPNQVKKAQALHPWIKYQPDGRIRIDSPREYKEVRKALNMVDLRKR